MPSARKKFSTSIISSAGKVAVRELSEVTFLKVNSHDYHVITIKGKVIYKLIYYVINMSRDYHVIFV